MERTALVVDDSKSARFALRRHLEGHAFKVETADCAQEAYRLVQAQRPDLIFLDHIMPGIDGFAAMRQFKQDPATATIPVVICSSNEGDAFISEARDQGAVGVLPKPPTPEHLHRLLASIALQEREQEIEASLSAAQLSDDQGESEALLDLESDTPTTMDTFNSPVATETAARSEEHTSELQSLMRIPYAVTGLKTKQQHLKIIS